MPPESSCYTMFYEPDLPRVLGSQPSKRRYEFRLKCTATLQTRIPMRGARTRAQVNAIARKKITNGEEDAHFRLTPLEPADLHKSSERQ